MKVNLFDYHLPSDYIAQHPCSPREDAGLLHIDARGGLSDYKVRDIEKLLRPGDLVLVNDCKVLPGRLTARRLRPHQSECDQGAMVDITLIGPVREKEHTHHSRVVWRALARPLKRIDPGDRLIFLTDPVTGPVEDRLMANVVEKLSEASGPGALHLSFDQSDNSVMDFLWQKGRMPLPPYIKRDQNALQVAEQDRLDYQSLFAVKAGAAAAPTASLHITPELKSSLENKGITFCPVTLMVGEGTFLPVKVTNTDDHRMHAEWGDLDEKTAERINRQRQNGGRVVALGTTVLRLLEAAAISGTVQPFSGYTDIFITPGFHFKAVDVLITNFHLPKSTLLMLVSAFHSLPVVMAAYQHAIEQKYRFYSYGDACFIERPQDSSQDNLL